MMQRCPNCGKYMVRLIEYTSGCSMQLWSCACGYTSRMDRSGLRSMDVTNKYMFEVGDKDEVRSWKR